MGIEVKTEASSGLQFEENAPVSLHGQREPTKGIHSGARFCGYHGHADLVAALNILGRLGDKEIRMGMPPSRVKKQYWMVVTSVGNH
ncbi:MAG: hypothetical protein ACLSE8_04350 [Parasutterella sp.]